MATFIVPKRKELVVYVQFVLERSGRSIFFGIFCFLVLESRHSAYVIRMCASVRVCTQQGSVTYDN